MKTYGNKDGILMIFRALIITFIALIVLWFGYRICRPKQIQEYKLEAINRDLGDIVFVTNANGDFCRVK